MLEKRHGLYELTKELHVYNTHLEHGAQQM